MRLSPALLALMTVSAAWGFCDRAQGQTFDDTAPTIAVATPEPSTETVAAKGEATPNWTPPAAPSTVAVTPPSTALVDAPRSSQPLVAEDLGAPLSLEQITTSNPVPEQALNQATAVQAAPTTTPTTMSQQLGQAPQEEMPQEEMPQEEMPQPQLPPPQVPQPQTPNIPEIPDFDPSIPPPAIPPLPEDAEDSAPPEDPNPPEQPDTPPTAPPEGGQPQAEEPRVLVAEVDVEGVVEPLTPELEDEVYGAIGTRPGRDTTRSQLQQDINSIFETGFFANVQAVPEDTPLGVRVTFVVQPNPILQSVEVSNNEVLPQMVVDDIFDDQYGRIINLIDFQNGILALNQWYQENGYVLAEVTAAPRVAADGTVTLIVAEGVIDNIDVRFLNAEGSPTDNEGNPIQGVTRDFIITREFQTQPGDVFNEASIQRDLERVFGLGIFDDVRLSLERSSNRQVNVIVNVIERSTGSVAAGLGFNFTGDLFGTVSYRQDNFGGNNQKFSAETQLSFRDLLFDISFTDPWIAGDPNRTSYTLNAFARRSVSLVFDNGPIEVGLANGDDVRVNRFGGGVTFGRPLGGGWSGSLGTQIQRVSTRFSGGAIATADALGNPLSLSGIGQDDLWTVQLGLVRDLRNDPLNPTQGSIFRVSTDQSIPLGLGNIFLNRVQASYSYYIPVSLINFSDGPQAFAFNIQAGTVLGDLPPYEAFALGGTNSVRGYQEGGLASGRSYLQASAEYRFPLFSFIGGAFFVDAATDLGSGFAVLGSPGPVRGKQGSGFGYGAGVRVQTPLGPLRIDYGFNDRGEGRLHFGIGERF